MRRLFFLLLPVMLLAACSRVPDHAKYIPKNAVSVIGLNTKALGKKITWDKFTGNNAEQRINAALQENGLTVRMEDLKESGIDLNNTLYLFVTSKGGLSYTSPSNPMITAILPISNAGKWEAFLKKSFPQMQPQTATGAKAALLNDDASVLWTDKVAFIANNAQGQGAYITLPDSTEEWQEGKADVAATLTGLQNLLKLEKGETVVADDRFTKLEKSGHDLTLWINYEQIMSGMGGLSGMAGMMGNKLWKNTVMASAADFNDGQVDAEMWYYPSDELKEVSKEMGSGNVSEAMMEKLPKDNLVALMGMNFPMNGFRTVLEKMGIMGMANMGLASQGLSIDDLLEAFTGDVAVSVNNFKMMSALDTVYGMSPSSTTADYTIALKIGKEEKLKKLLDFAVKRKMLEQIAPDTYAPPGVTGTPSSAAMVLDKTYLVVAKTAAQARSYVAGSGLKNIPEAAAKLTGKGPYAVFVDLQKMLLAVDPSAAQTNVDQVSLVESKKLFENATMSGGRFSDNRFSYTGVLNLMNKKENALVQVLQFVGKIQQARKEDQKAMPSPSVYEPGTQVIDTFAAPVGETRGANY